MHSITSTRNGIAYLSLVLSTSIQCKYSMMKKFHERRLQEERKRNEQNEKSRWIMIEKAISQETKRKAMRDAESTRLQQKAYRLHHETIARENQAGCTTCFRRCL
jgi:uncharacterized protein (DUF2147 family)